MRQQSIIPVYLLTGFLESGKTTMIQSMLADEGFTDGQKTLIILCEEGMTELDEDRLKGFNTQAVLLEEPEDFTSLRLKELNNQYKPERVIIEFNTMWGVETIGRVKMPPRWECVQIISLADATTFESYMLNMRKLLTDPMKVADLILINRCTPAFNKSGWRRQLRALNPMANILFENTDGTTEDGVADEDLPYDMKAEIIDVTDEQFGTLYLDAMEHPDRYDGKTVRLIGQPFPDRGFPKGFYYFGRYAMTCCANDIAKCGWVCQGTAVPSDKDFLRLTARCEKVTSPEGQEALLLHELKTEKTLAPKEEYVTFTNP